VAIIGPNGSGKTNLLDAIYYLCFTKSYFNKKEKNNIQFLKDGFRISGVFNTSGHQHTITCIYRDNKKTISKDKVDYSKISEHIGFQTAVIIAPDDIDIINGYAEERRKFIDGMLSQMDNQYLQHWLEYQKILSQKQYYLKNAYPHSVDLIQIYNEQMQAAAQYIIDKRQEFTQILTPIVQKYYAFISNNSEEIRLAYASDFQSQKWQTLIPQYLNAEIQAKRCLVGPHLDDWDFYITELPLKSNGSQGQKKSFLLALKLAQIELLNLENKFPILLLDDIFEKLDPNRLNALFDTLHQLQLSQIFLTHTDIYLIQYIVKKHYPHAQIIELIK